MCPHMTVSMMRAEAIIHGGLYPGCIWFLARLQDTSRKKRRVGEVWFEKTENRSQCDRFRRLRAQKKVGAIHHSLAGLIES